MSNQTGPRAEEGKKASSQNNRRHGLSTANVIVSPAERPLFDQLEAELRDEIDIEGLAIRRLVTATWQMENCRQKEATLDQNPERERRVADPRTTPPTPRNQQLARRNPTGTRSVSDGLPTPAPPPATPAKSTTCETKSPTPGRPWPT